MKKILIAIMLCSSFLSFAEPSKKCRDFMDERLASEKEMMSIIAKALDENEISLDQALDRIEELDTLAQMTATICSIQRLTKAQNSIRGKLGLTSLERAERIAKKEYELAIKYYKENTHR